MDIVIPLGRGSTWNDNELRYSLRSLNHLTGLRDVYLLGHKPSWCHGVKHYPHPDPHACKERNIMEKVLYATRIPELSERFLFMNDDHFLLRPADIDMPNYRGRPLQQYDGPKNNYQRGVNRTVEALTERGLPTWNFDIHVPIVMDKRLFEPIMASYNWEHRHGYVLKSLYANTAKLESEKISDVKLNERQSFTDIVATLRPRTWFSIGPSILNDRFKQFLQQLYPDPSPFE